MCILTPDSQPIPENEKVSLIQKICAGQQFIVMLA